MKTHIYLEAKKTARADLEAHRPLLLSIGLFLSLSIVTISFQAKQRIEKEVQVLSSNESLNEVLQEVPTTEIPPPPPSMQMPQIVEVPDEVEVVKEIDVSFDVEVGSETRVQEITLAQPSEPEIEKEDVDEVFVVVEESAQPENGMAEFYKLTASNLRYPAQARRMGVEGRVFVQFVVAKDGGLQEVEVIKGIGSGCDEEAVRIVSLSPKWKPAKQRGKPVKQRIVLPILFKLHRG
jgi:protein TonB